MIPDLDIYRTANLLAQQHGEDAPIHAAMRADAMPSLMAGAGLEGADSVFGSTRSCGCLWSCG